MKASSIRPFAFALFTAVLLAGCDSTENGQTPSEGIAAAGGAGQSAAPGATLPTMLRVRVTQGGSPVQGQQVTWSVTAGGGSVDPAQSTTDASGHASTEWTLGPNAGQNTVQASAAGVTGSPITFNATAVVPTPAPSAVSVSVEDFFFNPTSARLAVGGTVTWNWGGAVGHNVTFTSGSSSSTQTSGSFSRTFPSAGSFSYRCTIHAQMNGTINVE